MAHIHTKAGQHDHTVCAIIVRLDKAEPLALLHMHRKLGKLLPVGGHIELDETPWQAIEHEILEESGYSLSQLTLLQPKQRIKVLRDATLHPYPVVINTHSITDSHRHTDLTYAFVTHEEPMSAVGQNESLDLRWLTLAEINNAPDSDMYGNTRDMYTFVMNECLSSWEQVSTNTFAL
jgi:8-oxo-dGTP diphosphatase